MSSPRPWRATRRRKRAIRAEPRSPTHRCLPDHRPLSMPQRVVQVRDAGRRGGNGDGGQPCRPGAWRVMKSGESWLGPMPRVWPRGVVVRFTTMLRGTRYGAGSPRIEEENARLKKLLAESMLDVSTLKEMLAKNWRRLGRGDLP